MWHLFLSQLLQNFRKIRDSSFSSKDFHCFQSEHRHAFPAWCIGLWKYAVAFGINVVWLCIKFWRGADLRLLLQNVSEGALFSRQRLHVPRGFHSRGLWPGYYYRWAAYVNGPYHQSTECELDPHTSATHPPAVWLAYKLYEQITHRSHLDSAVVAAFFRRPWPTWAAYSVVLGALWTETH